MASPMFVQVRRRPPAGWLVATIIGALAALAVPGVTHRAPHPASVQLRTFAPPCPAAARTRQPVLVPEARPADVTDADAACSAALTAWSHRHDLGTFDPRVASDDRELRLVRDRVLRTCVVRR
jgi:hypothetical protein